MISLEWVSDYIDIKGLNPHELATKITEAGINIEKVITNHIDNLVIGEVVDCVNHPNSDHLHVCQVNVGNELVQIVCGASNVRKGLKVIVALPGAVLPGNFVIQKGKIRDVESNGMSYVLLAFPTNFSNSLTSLKKIFISAVSVGSPWRASLIFFLLKS